MTIRGLGDQLVATIDHIIGQSTSLLPDDLLRVLLGSATGRIRANQVFRLLCTGGRHTARLNGCEVSVLARPGEPLSQPLGPGDFLVRKALGEGKLAHVAVAASPEFERAELSRAGLIPEDDGPGWFVQVVEGGFQPHRLADRFARRVRDQAMRATPDQLILRLVPIIDSANAGEDSNKETGDRTTNRLVSRRELRESEEMAEWIQTRLAELEKQRFMSTAQKEEYAAGVQLDLEEVKKLRHTRVRVGEEDRKRARLLLDNFRDAKEFPNQVRRAVERARSLRGRRLFTQFDVVPPVIRIGEHEAARVSIGSRALPKRMSAHVVEGEAEGSTIRLLMDINAPKDRYQTAVWEGLFSDAKAPPETGTYMLIVSISDDSGTERLMDFIRVENPSRRTVRPRAESEYGEALKSLKFDGSSLTLEDKLGKIIRVRAVSGLRPNNPHNREELDYTRPSCQSVKDRGPIPAGGYKVRKNTVQTPTLARTAKGDVLRYASGGTERRWGPFRAPISPSGICGREDFFIHLDVKDDGTAGCIGVHRHDVGKFNLMMKVMSRMTSDVELLVEYPSSTLDCYGLPATCEQRGSEEATTDTKETPDDALWRPLSVGQAAGAGIAEARPGVAAPGAVSSRSGPGATKSIESGEREQAEGLDIAALDYFERELGPGVSTTAEEAGTLPHSAPAAPRVLVYTPTLQDDPSERPAPLSPLLAGDRTLAAVLRSNGLIQLGNHGESVRKIQAALALTEPASGVRQIEPDGVFGRLTLTAVKDFQREFGIKSDGKVGRKTLYWLDRALERGYRFPLVHAGDAPMATLRVVYRDPSIRLGRVIRARQPGEDPEVETDTTEPELFVHVEFHWQVVAGPNVPQGKAFLLQNIRFDDLRVFWRRPRTGARLAKQSLLVAQGLDHSLPYGEIVDISGTGNTGNRSDQDLPNAVALPEFFGSPPFRFEAGDIVVIQAERRFRTFVCYSSDQSNALARFQVLQFVDWGYSVVACFVKGTGDASDWRRQVMSQDLHSPVSGGSAPVFLGPHYNEDEDKLRWKQLSKNRIPWVPTVTCG